MAGIIIDMGPPPPNRAVSESLHAQAAQHHLEWFTEAQGKPDILWHASIREASSKSTIIVITLVRKVVPFRTGLGSFMKEFKEGVDFSAVSKTASLFLGCESETEKNSKEAPTEKCFQSGRERRTVFKLSLALTPSLKLPPPFDTESMIQQVKLSE